MYSPGFEVEQQTKPEVTKILEGADEGQAPEEVARECLKGLQRGETMVTTSFLGELTRGAMWGMTPKGTTLRDLFMGWLAAVIWLFVGPDLDRKVLKYRKEHGVPQKSTYVVWQETQTIVRTVFFLSR